MFVPQLAVQLRKKLNEVFYEGRVVPKHTETQHFYQDVEDGQIYASVTTKTSLLSRDYYKQLAADKAVDHIQSHVMQFSVMEPEQITEVFTYAREAHVHDLSRAGMWGTHGHDTVDKYVDRWITTGKRPESMTEFFGDVSNEGKCAALSAEKFMHDYTLFPLASELKVISKKHAYAGTLDSLWLIGDVYKDRVGETNCEHDWFNKSKDRVACGLCGREEKLSVLLGDWKTSNYIFGVGTMSKFDYALQVMAYAIALKEMAGITCKKYWIVRLDKQSPHYEIGVITDPKRATKAFLAINEVSNFARSKTPPIEPLFKKQVITL
jgi:hypothetical protein